jgi:hypothetical protein
LDWKVPENRTTEMRFLVEQPTTQEEEQAGFVGQKNKSKKTNGELPPIILPDCNDDEIISQVEESMGGEGEERTKNTSTESLNAEEGGGVGLGRRWRQSSVQKKEEGRRAEREFGEKNGDEGEKKISGGENKRKTKSAKGSEATGVISIITRPVMASLLSSIFLDPRNKSAVSRTLARRDHRGVDFFQRLSLLHFPLGYVD